MLRFEWNALRVGDPVHVHHSPATERRAALGSVHLVQMSRRENGVGILVTEDDGSSRVVWPSRLMAHLAAVDEPGACWRCDEVARPSMSSS